MPNRLADQVSPYLLQHRTNPVDWWPWGPEALAAARAEGKPIFLSIGYAACHWCHVMAHESFENPDIAALMNDLFINIKVDREERPDIDQIYMAAIHAFGEQGGWPLSVFLTPDGVPVWGGTYFPPESRYGRPGFPDVLRRIDEIFRTDGDKIARTGESVTRHLNRPAPSADGTTVDRPLLDKAAETLHGIMDRRLGGTAGAPKFPQSALLETLWRAGTRAGDEALTDTVTTTLTGMSLGGIYDHIGGGYARYSVDAQWLVPHFEKMLYDNAQIVAMLTTAWSKTGNPLFATRVAETIAWLEREMRTAGGAFAASLDADTNGEEGLTYLWTPAEAETGLGAADAELFCRTYDITDSGNFEGRSIPNRLNAPPPLSDLEERKLADMRARLLEARNARPQPGLDDKVLADWNGLMIAALPDAAFVFIQPSWLDLATRAFAFVETTMGRDDRLAHSWRDGKSVWPGLATDTAFMAHAALRLASVTGDAAYVEKAQAWVAATERHHAAGDGYYLSADDADALIARPRADNDDAIPAATALMAANHIRLWNLTGDDAHRARADAIISGAGARIATNTFASASLLNAFDLRLRAKTAVVVIPPGADPTPALQPLRNGWSPNLIIQIVDADAPLPDSHPAADKTAIDGQPTVYICREGACSLPATDLEAISALLAGA